MFLKPIIFVLALTYLVVSSDEVDIRKTIRNLYGSDVKNFGTAFNHLSKVNDVENKIVAFKELVHVMKENDHLYSNEILKLAYELKRVIDEYPLTDTSDEVMEIKELLPASVYNVTFCPKVKIYQTTLEGYLYGDLKVLWDKDNRYTFADGNFNDLTTTWRIISYEEFVYIFNDFLNEALFPQTSAENVVLCWIKYGAGTLFEWAIELVYGTKTIRLRNRFLNQYLYATNETISGKRILKTALYPKNSFWEFHCAE